MVEPCWCSAARKIETSNVAYRVRETNIEPKLSEEEVDRLFASCARHEAGHVVAGAARGIACERVTIGGNQPHARQHADGLSSLLDAMTVSLAGSIAELAVVNREWRPSWSFLARHVLRAREGKTGVCDRCREAAVLVACFADLDNAEIVERWFAFFDSTADFVATDEWSRAIDELADALIEKTLLEREEIDAMLCRHDLVGAMQRAIEIE